MGQTVITEHDEKRFRQRLYEGLRWGAVCLTVILLTVLAIVAPLPSLLPAYKIPPREEGELRLHFLSVGDSDCTIVEFPDDALVVIDAGDGGFTYGNRVLRYIKGLNYSSLTYIVTQADASHYGGFVPLAAYLGADNAYLPVVEGYGSSYKKLKTTLSDTGCTVQTLSRYSVIENPSGGFITCLSPNSLEDEDDGAAVLFLSYEGVRVMLCSDISSAREKRILNDYALEEDIFDAYGYEVRLEHIDLIKTAAHGSAYSSSEAWLNLLSPAYAVISCGQGNRYRHPAVETVTRLSACGARIVRTDELGDIVFGIANGNLTERSYI